MSSSAAHRARRATGHRKVAPRAGAPAAPVKSAARPHVPAARSSCAQMLWRSFIEAANTPTVPRWYGNTPWWQVALEGQAHREFGERLEIRQWPGLLEYRVAVDVHGPHELSDVVVRFYEVPPYETFGLDPCDYPRVFADPGLPSKHRMPDDDALCLYYPLDPPEMRWTPDKGLLGLLDLVVDHLGYEAYWRATGGPDGGVWLGDEAEHGLTQEAA